MKLKEIVLMATLGASALVGCTQSPQAQLEPLAVAWSTGKNANYQKLEDARVAVYNKADTNRDGKVSYAEASAMIRRCPTGNDYNCNGK